MHLSKKSNDWSFERPRQRDGAPRIYKATANANCPTIVYSIDTCGKFTSWDAITIARSHWPENRRQ